MSDKLMVLVDNVPVTPKSVRVDSDIYAAAGTVELTFSEAVARNIHAGQTVMVLADNVTVFTGIIETLRGLSNKQGASVTASGRDLMGLVVDHHIESFKTLKNKTLQAVAEHYLKDIPFVNRLNITYLGTAASLDVPQEFIQPQPGQTVFDLLSGIAAARGIHFYMLPDGNIVFGKPAGFGIKPFSVWCTAHGFCNAEEYSFVDDLTERFSRVTICGQTASTPALGIGALNKKAIIADNEFTFYIKPLVVETNLDGVSLTQQARMIVEQRRNAGWQLGYTVAGFSQNGNVWRTDASCTVNDVRIPFSGECLIYGRSFVYDKSQAITEIRLSKMGVR